MNIYQARNRLKELSGQILNKGDAMTGAEATAALAEWNLCEKAITLHANAARLSGGLPGDDGSPVPGSGGQPVANKDLRGKASEYAPLGFSTDQLKSMHQAMSSNSPYAIRTKAFSSVDALLPADLQSSVVGPQYEGRLLDHLQILPTQAPSIEYIRHTSTTGSPAITAEGSPKPELVFVTDSIVVAAQKIAAHAAISWETKIRGRGGCAAGHPQAGLRGCA
jgi:hypothetical protein